MPTDLVDALGPATADHPLVLVMRRYAVRPVPPRTQPELALNRAFVLPVARTFDVQGSAAISTEASPAAIQAAYGIPDAEHGGVTMHASAVLPGCAACGPDAAIDGDPLTAWQTPLVEVKGQFVSYTNAKALTFDHMTLRVVADGRHSVPTRLKLAVDGRTQVLDVPAIDDQAAENASTPVELRFPQVTGKNVTVTIDDVRPVRTKRFSSDEKVVLPAAIAEFGIDGLTKPDAPATVDSGCRTDLASIDGKPLPVRVTGTPAGVDAVLTLTVAACDPDDPDRAVELTLPAGRHVLTTARGKDAGWSIDRLVFASGTDGTELGLADGRVSAAGRGAQPAAPKVELLRSGRTSMRARVTGATEPFWMVLGQSHSPGWEAKVVGGESLGEPQLVDGFANGWLVTPTAADFEIDMEWVPQRQVWASLWMSLLAALVCAGIVAATWRRRVSSAAVASASDAAIDVRIADAREAVRPGAWVRIGAPLLAGVIAGLTVAPWVGVLIAAVTALIASFRNLRRYVLFVPAVLIVMAGVYIAVQQQRYEFPPVFEWPTLFPRARTAAWIAVMLLVGDVIVEVFRARGRIKE
jgi:arabinofuranan 3-O-arabinosyltransferase